MTKPFVFVTAVHKDVSERLKKINPKLYRQVKELMDTNKQERHIRGGMATKNKYAREKNREKKAPQWRFFIFKEPIGA